MYPNLGEKQKVVQSFAMHFDSAHFLLAGILCPDLQTPANGSKSNDMVLPDTLVNFDCDSGYVLSDQSTLRCQPDGEWNGTAPFCFGNSSML